MKAPQEVKSTFQIYGKCVESILEEVLSEAHSGRIYDIMRYFMGFVDAEFHLTNGYGGKRFRSSLLLLIADMYNSCSNAVNAAASLELFHNFTLIHDDIYDRDEFRRGRETVWKIWGDDVAINAGDAQFILAQQQLVEAAKKNPEVGSLLHSFFNDQYLTVMEGQNLDFELSEKAFGHKSVTEEGFFSLIRKKTGVLLGTAAKGAGIVSGVSEDERENLWQYGLHLGMAYQLNDDLFSIWGGSNITGKKSYNDLIEKKKTLPLIYAHNKLSGVERQELEDIYHPDSEVTSTQAIRIVEILEKVGAYEYVWGKIEKEREIALMAVAKLAVHEEQKAKLASVLEVLLPDVRKKQ